MKSIWLTIFIITAIGSMCVSQASPDEPGNGASSAADLVRGKQPGQVRDDNGLKMKLVWCPPGTFTMGSPKSETHRKSNEDQVEVTLTDGFWIGKFEVTQSDWKQVQATEPWAGKGSTIESDDLPATWIHWEAAMEFCRKLTERERKAGRVPNGWEFTLPTEAQWERACRAGTKTRYSFGDDNSKLRDYAWFDDTGFSLQGNSHPVGQKKPNPWGVHDMHGNVWEWCRDWYVDKLPGERAPEVIEKGSERVIRGGCVGFWCFQAGEGSYRSARRSAFNPSYQTQHLGFRVACSTVREVKD